MLYAITDKYDKPVGVHECAPEDILAHVRSLPPQGAPYLTQPAMPLLRRIRSQMRPSWYWVCGFLAGAATVEIVQIALR